MTASPTINIIYSNVMTRIGEGKEREADYDWESDYRIDIIGIIIDY